MRYTLIRNCVASACLLIGVNLAGGAQAQGIRQSENPLCDWELTGQITPATLESYEAARNATNGPRLGSSTDAHVLCLDSPGGSIEVGIELFRDIWRANIATVVLPGDTCASACALAFLGGGAIIGTGTVRFAGRAVYPGGQLGYHAPSLDLPETGETYPPELVNTAFAAAVDAAEAIVQIGTTIDQSAEAMNVFLLRRILGTLPDDMYFIETVMDFALADIEPFLVPDPGPLSEQHLENICDLAVFQFGRMEQRGAIDRDVTLNALRSLRQERRAQNGAVSFVARGVDQRGDRTAVFSHYPSDRARRLYVCEVSVAGFDPAWHRLGSDERYYIDEGATRTAYVNLSFYDTTTAFQFDGQTPSGLMSLDSLSVPIWYAYEPDHVLGAARPETGAQPAAMGAPVPQLEQGGDRSPDAAAAIDACEAVANPDNVPWADLRDGDPGRAEAVCRAALASVPDGASRDRANVQALLGRTLDVQQRYTEAIASYTSAAETGGHAFAANNLGILHEYGRGVPENDRVAARWYRNAAEAGSRSGMYNLARLYDSGAGVEFDLSEAFEWYRRAADAGHDAAMYRVGNAYRGGRGVDQNASLAATWFRRSAEAGYAPAMNAIGAAYQRGSGVAQDYAAALRWYGEAADLGNASATASLGFMHFRGLGTTRNPAEAIRLFEIAAQGGSTMAMRNLGVIYKDGQFVNRDYAVAMRWFRAAAVEGDGMAMRFIAWLYQNGQGVSRSPGQAADWYLQALAAGDDWLIGNTDEVTNDIVAQLQRRLQSQGYYTTAIDGAAGPGTIRALQAYMDAN